MALGHYIGLSGMVTFKSWLRDDQIRRVPLDRLLVETDAPYLAPAPHRGRRNEPARVVEVARRVAEVRGLAFDRDHVYAVTHAGAPKYKVVRTSVKHPDWEHAETIIPEAADSVQYIAKSKHYLLVIYSNGVVGRVVKYNLATGKTAEIKLPASGSVDVSCPDWRSDRCIVNITSSAVISHRRACRSR